MMYKTVLRYLTYRLTAPHRRGYGIHSPFIFHLVSDVFQKKDDDTLRGILNWRKKLGKNKRILQTLDAGAGSRTHKTAIRSIGRIVSRSSIKHKYGRILYYLAKDLKPVTIIELGSGIGVSTMYLSKACPGSRIISLEADSAKLEFVREEFSINKAGNVVFRQGNFEENLVPVLKESNHPVFIFIDGDHSYEATMKYFNEILNFIRKDTAIVFDDIRWSEGMERAWQEIQDSFRVKISIDLFFIGIVFFRDGIVKQDFLVNL